jgi:hypothetical protein
VPPTQAVRRAVTTVAVLFAVLAGQGLAFAGVQGAGSKTQVVSSGTFSVIPTTAAGTPPAGALTLIYGTVLPPAQYFDAVNTGTLVLTATSYSVVVTGGGVLGAPSIALSACVGGTWNTSTGTCSGTATPIGSWTSASSAAIASSAAPLAAAARLGIKATLSNGGVLGANTVAVITTTVSSSGPRQIRTATTTNS